MSIEVANWLRTAHQAFDRSLGFMTWNTFLAVVPWGLSLWLFKRPQATRQAVTETTATRSAATERADKLPPIASSADRGLLWWAVFVVFVAFLPNAPYVLTDIIHLVKFIREGAAMWTIVFVWMPQYFLFMLIGSLTYTLSLLNLGQYLKAQGKPHWVTPAEWLLHALCAFGIYLGRVPRFNSWDLLTHPGKIVSFVTRDIWQPQPMAVMLVMCLTLWAVYWPLKHLSLAVMLYVRTFQRRGIGVEQAPE